MASLTFAFRGPPEQKHVVKIGPMAPLGAALQEACGKFRPAVNPATCTVQFQKKPVALDSPFRLLNIPSGSRLEVVPGAGATATTGAAGSTHGSVASTSAPRPHTSAKAPQEAAGSSGSVVATAPLASMEVAPAPVGDSTPPSEPTEEGEDPQLKSLGIDKAILVFTHAAMEAAAAAQASSSSADVPDDFYELTPEDFALLQQQQQRRQKAEGAFRTKALRDAEQQSRAGTYGPVRVRLHYPDGYIVQATFKAIDPLKQVQALACQCGVPALRPGLYLYTAPPKTVLKDMESSLYAQQLIPAAHVHVGFDPKKCKEQVPANFHGPYLLPEVLQRTQEPPHEDQAAGTAGGEGGSIEQGRQEAVDVAAAVRTAASSQGQVSQAAAGSGGKAPKWLKLGPGTK